MTDTALRTADSPDAARRRLLDFRSGGGLLLVAGGLCALTVLFWVQRVASTAPRVGDGHNVASYGFDLSHCLVPPEQLVASGLSKDALPALSNPAVLSVAEVDVLNRDLRGRHQGKFLVDSDRVIGVVIAGEARAYPLRILNWHEIVNDVLGGQPIAVTYSPLCDSAVVFDRRVAGEILEFGFSGLLFNSNLLMYDRRSDRNLESLWSQLQFRAIAGPAALRGDTLAVLPAAVLPWADWRAQHPDTAVLAPDPARLKAYANTYDSYYGSDDLRFPVDPPPPADGPPPKTPMIAVRTTGTWHVLALPDLTAHADADGLWRTTVDGVDLTLHSRRTPLTSWVAADESGEVAVAYSFWFAWNALRLPAP